MYEGLVKALRDSDHAYLSVFRNEEGTTLFKEAADAIDDLNQKLYGRGKDEEEDDESF